MVQASEYANAIAPAAAKPEDYVGGKSDQYGWPINNFHLQKTYGSFTHFKVRDVAVAANVMALCRAFTDKYYAVEKGAVRHDILGPMNPMAPEVRFIEQWVDKAAYEEHKKSPLVKEFYDTLAKYGASEAERTVEEFAFEDGQKYGQQHRNAGRRIGSQFAFGIIVNMALKTPEIAQAQMKILRGHLERQLSTEPYVVAPRTRHTRTADHPVRYLSAATLTHPLSSLPRVLAMQARALVHVHRPL